MRKVQFEAGKNQLIALFVSDDTGQTIDPAAVYGAVAEDAAVAEGLGWRIVSMDTVPVRQLGTVGNVFFQSGGQFTTQVAVAVVYGRESAAA